MVYVWFILGVNLVLFRGYFCLFFTFYKIISNIFICNMFAESRMNRAFQILLK